MMMAAPKMQTQAPMKSQRSGCISSTSQSHAREHAIYIPPYAAYVRPAAGLSISVSRNANKPSEITPGRTHQIGLPRRSQVQNAKHPAISAIAAPMKATTVCIPVFSSFEDYRFILEHLQNSRTLQTGTHCGHILAMKWP